jgi:plastocyanin
MRLHARKKRFAQGSASLLLACMAMQNALGAEISVTVRSAAGMPLAGAVVMAQALYAGRHPNTPVHAIMDQIKLAFVPDLLVIPVGSTVQFPNTDSVSHQIYSFSPARRFQLPLYRGTQYPPVLFDQPGVVTLGCNIHDGMLAYIVVSDAAFFGRTDAGGVWSMGSMPPGRYRISVWHPRMREALGEIAQEVQLVETSRSDATLHIGKPLKPAPLEARPRSWNAY